MTRHAPLTEDLVQQTLLRIHRHRARYVVGAPVLPWAFAIARRLAIDEFRRRRLDAQHRERCVLEAEAPPSTLPDDELATRRVAVRVDDAIERLPPPQRAAFELLRVHGLSHDAAARALGVTVSVVKQRAFRAYSTLRSVVREPELSEEEMAAPTRA